MTETVTVGAPSPDSLTAASSMLAVALRYKIECVEMREAAGEDLKRVKLLSRNLEAERTGITKPLDLAKGRVMGLFRSPLEFLDQAEQIIKRACRQWDDEQDRIRREAEALAAREADMERRRLAALAAEHTKQGNVETAHVVTQAAQMVAPVPVHREVAKVAGESTRELWRADVTDVVALCRAVADGKASPECVLPNTTVLNGMARSLKGTLSIPGVRAYSEKILATRAA